MNIMVKNKLKKTNKTITKSFIKNNLHTLVNPVLNMTNNHKKT
jgi:hypothetical protein